ncbi:MAG: ABC transporter permease, partial [Pseudomonadota bacterium]
VPIIGTTQAFVDHLGGGEVSEGRGFETPFDVIAGALHPIAIGESFEPAHGFGAAVVEGLHGDVLTVVGRMPATGSPWDHVLVTPIEGVWMTHGLASGHAPGNERLGPPYDARFFPGTPAVVVVPESLSSAYRLRNAFNSDPALMAIFPGTELIELYSVLGDVRQVMAALARLTQGIIAVGVLTALFILLRLFAQQLSLLAVLGAPDRFRLAVIWGYAGALLTAGTVAGLGLGGVSAHVIGRALTAETNITIAARMGWGEVANAAAFLTLSLVVALATSALGLRRLRGAR